MSLVDQELPLSSDVASKSAPASQFQPQFEPAIPDSTSLEDGEITEGRSSSVSSQLQPLRQLEDQPRPPSSSQVDSLTPAKFQTAGSVVPTVESMTKEDLDHAKSLVLDLLGWGVSPEYLVECGLSTGAIYKIFTDLRLRLPSNLQAPSPPHSGT